MKGKSASKTMWVAIVIVAVVVAIGLFAFSGNDRSSSVDDSSGDVGSGDSGQANIDQGSSSSGGAGESDGEIPSWMEYELTNVLTGETFKISDFSGRPILLESFAVWCPTCTAQQENIKELHEEPGYGGEDLISISLDLDQNEDSEKVKSHAQSNGFDWYYVVAPEELTQELIAEFGPSFISAPSVPMVLICEDLSFRKLDGFGRRSVEELKDEIAAGCSN